MKMAPSTFVTLVVRSLNIVVQVCVHPEFRKIPIIETLGL